MCPSTSRSHKHSDLPHPITQSPAVLPVPCDARCICCSVHKNKGEDSLRKRSHFSSEAEADQSSASVRIRLFLSSQLMLMIHTGFDLVSFHCLLLWKLKKKLLPVWSRKWMKNTRFCVSFWPWNSLLNFSSFDRESVKCPCPHYTEKTNENPESCSLFYKYFIKQVFLCSFLYIYKELWLLKCFQLCTQRMINLHRKKNQLKYTKSESALCFICIPLYHWSAGRKFNKWKYNIIAGEPALCFQNRN